MKLWVINFQYGYHEDEWEIMVAGDKATTTDGRAFLLMEHAKDDSGYMFDAIEDPELLTVSSVYELITVTDIDGMPYQVSVKG